MREIKFRAWHIKAKTMLYPEKQWYLFGWKEDESQPIEIMQYTGLKDKNGKEIYEGDVVKFKIRIFEERYQETLHSIVFDSGSFCFKDSCSVKTLREWNSFIEIVGNKFENPELLEQQ